MSLNSRSATRKQSAVVRGCMALPAIAIVTALSFSAPAAAPAQQSAQAKMTEDLPSGAMQAKTTTACTECHEARIIVQQRLSKAAWTKEVDKMIKWGAVVDAADHDALVDYLSANFSPDQPPYEPPRTFTGTSTEKVSGKKTSK